MTPGGQLFAQQARALRHGLESVALLYEDGRSPPLHRGQVTLHLARHRPSRRLGAA